MRDKHDQAMFDGTDLVKGILAGAVAGYVGTVVMTAFQQRLQKEMQRPVSAEERLRNWQPWQREESSELQESHMAGGLEPAKMQEEQHYHEPGEQENHGQDQNRNNERGGQSQQQSEPATAQVAQSMARMTGHELDEEQKQVGSEVVHYGFGTTMGAVYGGAAEYLPVVTSGVGLTYGAGLFLLADEAAVPALKLSPPPTQVPRSTHAYALVSHLVYGVTVEVVRRVVRRVLC